PRQSARSDQDHFAAKQFLAHLNLVGRDEPRRSLIAVYAMAREVLVDRLPFTLDHDVLAAHEIRARDVLRAYEIGDGDVVAPVAVDAPAEVRCAQSGELERRLAQRLRRDRSRVD